MSEFEKKKQTIVAEICADCSIRLVYSFLQDMKSETGLLAMAWTTV